MGRAVQRPARGGAGGAAGRRALGVRVRGGRGASPRACRTRDWGTHAEMAAALGGGETRAVELEVGVAMVVPR